MSNCTTSTGSSRPVPLFVFGIVRSGTTWVANVLAGHSEVAAVEAADHFGVHESIFFSHFARAYGDPDDDVNFGRFTDDFVASDYYVLSGVDPDWLPAARPRTYPEIFRGLMEQVCAQRGNARYWLEKSPDNVPFFMDRIRDDFPDARFVCVTRAALTNANSRLWLTGQGAGSRAVRMRTLVRFAWKRGLCNRVLARFAATERGATLVEYETFAADPEREARRLCDFMGLAFEPGMLSQRYKRNTSFPDAKRKTTLSAGERSTVLAVTAAAHIVPFALLDRVLAFAGPRRKIVWPAWCWKRRDAVASR